MKTIAVTLSGVTPLMMHNDQLANPMNEYAKQLKEYTSKRQKTDEDYEAIAQIEFLGGIYYSDQSGIYIPGRNVRKCIENGATLMKKGTAVKRGVFVVEAELPLTYSGPRTPKDLYRTKAFVDTRTAGNNKARIVRTRPIFAPPWSLTATLMVDPSQINDSDLRQCIDMAGKLCGLGDYRPYPSGGTFGIFQIGDWKA
jgi:hypothetical protein